MRWHAELGKLPHMYSPSVVVFAVIKRY